MLWHLGTLVDGYLKWFFRVILLHFSVISWRDAGGFHSCFPSGPALC